MLVEFIAGLADKAGIKYKIGTETTTQLNQSCFVFKRCSDDVFAVDDLLSEEEQPVEEKEKPKLAMKRPTEMETA